MSTDGPFRVFNNEQIEQSTETTIVCCFARGAFHSSVYGCLNTEHQAVAVKVYDREASKSRGERILSEKTVLTRLSLFAHPYITQLIRTTKDDQHLYFILEAHLGNHLQAHITAQHGFSLLQTRFYTAELIIALLFLAEQGVIHRDIKSKNILLDAKGHIKLCDFGLAKILIDDKNEASKLYSVVGTLPYMAPEMIAKRGYSMQIDWYSMGVLMYEMMCGEFPVYKNDYRKFTQTLPDEHAMTQARMAVDDCTEMVSVDETTEWMPLVQGKEHIFHCSEEHQACWDLIMALLQVYLTPKLTSYPFRMLLSSDQRLLQRRIEPFLLPSFHYLVRYTCL